MTDRPGLPPGVLLGFYGDDFTGSSAVMEVLSFAGLPTVLFLAPPTPDELLAFRDHRAIGIAGLARAKSPAWMEEHLPPVFKALAGLQAPITHYKVCSTFDSSPALGSIGKAIELGALILRSAWHPLLVAAPPIGRWQAFGNLFATAGGSVCRLDRHPTMARHPATPMDEADIRLHLARQTNWPIGLVDTLALHRDAGAVALAQERARGARIVALDVMDETDLAAAGRLIWTERGEHLFAIGSQGLEYALVAWWRAAGLLPPPAPHPAVGPAGAIVAVSGSCSPLTALQIETAQASGFRGLRLDAAKAVDERAFEGEIERGLAFARRAQSEGADALLYTASGPDDPAVADLSRAIEASGTPSALVHERLGRGLGLILHRLRRETGLARAAVAGGDTSGHATQALGVRALEALAPLAPGAPLCLAHFAATAERRFEIVLKGGQMGAADFFVALKEGRAA